MGRGNRDGCGYLGTISGIFKLFSIILGGMSLGLGSYAHFESFYIWKIKEEAFVAASAICFGISLFYFFAHLSRETLRENSVNRIIDFIFHLLAGIVLAVISGLVIESTVEIDRKVCRHFSLWPYNVPCQLYYEKLAAAILQAVNGVLYGISALLILGTE